MPVMLEKLQNLQNRCLCMCLDINNPRDISVMRLHTEVRINLLDVRREIQILKIMFPLKCSNKYKKIGSQVNRNIDRYVFNTDIVHHIIRVSCFGIVCQTICISRT